MDTCKCRVGKQDGLICPPEDFKGKLVNCYFEARDDETEYPFISRPDGTIVPNLEGYAIVPLDIWERVTER